MGKLSCGQKIDNVQKKRDKARYQEWNRCKTDKCRKAKDKKANLLDKKILRMTNKEEKTGRC